MTSIYFLISCLNFFTISMYSDTNNIKEAKRKYKTCHSFKNICTHPFYSSLPNLIPFSRAASFLVHFLLLLCLCFSLPDPFLSAFLKVRIPIIIVNIIHCEFFHTIICWLSYIGVWVTSNLFRSSGLFSVFWPILTILGWSLLVVRFSKLQAP